MTWRMLTEAERIACLERVRDGQCGIANQKFKDQVIEALLDGRTWLIVLATMLISNIIIRNFGYTFVDRSCLDCSILTSLSDRGKRWYLQPQPVLWKYFLCYPAAGTLIKKRDVSDWNVRKHFIRQQYERVHEDQFICFSVGNIIGTEIFQLSDAPSYIPGKTTIMILLTTQIGVAYLLRYINIRLNRKKLKTLAELKAAKGWTDEVLQRSEAERHAFADTGNSNSQK
ncbi:hypothetical protein JVT61DRAFT_13121 [Boletus reticuloceps]|uniref:Uncharacterized protein n=1 Tax=Boletus reticuloceps TaxID=495285 RepID=A0A8I3AB90_9AGAM|nr:hypothetical protein JVT61DRAFT_13121 [Boletus reticuloceps]